MVLSLKFFSALGGNTNPQAGITELEHGRPIIGELDLETRATIVSESKRYGLKHAKYHPFATALLTKPMLQALKCFSNDDESTGVICTGGPLHGAVAWDFAAELVEDGPDLVNPLLFPQTIPSTVSATLARLCLAQAFALTVGHDHLAFFEALFRARQFLRFGQARTVLIGAAFDANWIIRRAMEKTYPTRRAGDTALSACLHMTTMPRPFLKLLHVTASPTDSTPVFAKIIAEHAIPVARQFVTKIRGDRSVETSHASLVEQWEAGNATGAVLCVEAACLMWKDCANRTAPFLVTCQQGDDARGVAIQWVE